MFVRDRRWNSCYTLSDGKHNFSIIIKSCSLRLHGSQSRLAVMLPTMLSLRPKETWTLVSCPAASCTDGWAPPWQKKWRKHDKYGRYNILVSDTWQCNSFHKYMVTKSDTSHAQEFVLNNVVPQGRACHSAYWMLKCQWKHAELARMLSLNS